MYTVILAVLGPIGIIVGVMPWRYVARITVLWQHLNRWRYVRIGEIALGAIFVVARGGVGAG